MTCAEIITELRNIVSALNPLSLLSSINENIKAVLKALTDIEEIHKGVRDGWNYEYKGKSWMYNRTVTYEGTTQTINLDFLKTLQLNRIEQIWNDATAKDFSVRISPVITYFTELDTQTANTGTSRIVQLGNEYKYPGGSRLQFYYSTYTVGKIVTLRVQVDEL